MSAPLPLRFYNPVKGLCEKLNLDYETVIGTGLSSKMREAYLLADIPKEIKDIDKKDIKHLQHKIEFLNKKYGDGQFSETRTEEGEVEDKGRIRYDAGLVVQPVLPDDCEMDQSNSIRYGMENSKSIKYTRKELLWCPGRGLIKGSELGMD
jgi:hypothetical protein